MTDKIRLFFERRAGRVIRFAVTLLLFGAAGCAVDQAPEEKPENPFFDLRTYFNRQIERLQEAQPPVEKTVRFEGKTQTEQLDSLDYSRELEVFLNADINRAAWWDKYRIDSVREGGRLQAVHYTATDESLRVDELSVFFSEEQVSRVEVKTSSEGFTADREQKLVYNPQKGYHIETMQDIAFSKPREMRIKVTFQK